MARAEQYVRVIVLCMTLVLSASTAVAEQGRTEHVLIHVKTALSVDDAQICAVPNIAWATLSEGDQVSLLFDASAVTSIAKGFGWRSWFGSKTTAMERAALPERERKSLAEQFGVPVDTVPRDYGEYLTFLKGKGVKLYYNRTMALLYNIEPETIDSNVTPLRLKEMTALFASVDRSIGY